MGNFKPQEHLTKLKGKDYLEVKWRLVWFRQEHPKGHINTDVSILTEDTAIVKATVYNSDGAPLATGIATVRSAENDRISWAGREFEKAETAAIGRALAHAGYGSQFTGEDEGDYLADSPVGNSNKQPKPQRPQQNSKGKPNPKHAQNRRVAVLEGTSNYFENMTDMMMWANSNGVNWDNTSEEIIAYINTAMANAEAV